MFIKNKIKNIFNKIIEKIFYINETPNGEMSHLNRRWRYMPKGGHYGYGKLFYIGWSTELVQYEGKPMEPRVIQEVQMQFIYHPKMWKIGQEHMYYDGPHCFYQFGPFRYYNGWRWCKKCYPEC